MDNSYINNPQGGNPIQQPFSNTPITGIPYPGAESDNLKDFWKSKSYERYYNRTHSNTSYGGLGHLEQLLQLLRLVHDGDLISKSSRDHLYSKELITRAGGFQIINDKGILLLISLGIINP